MVRRGFLTLAAALLLCAGMAALLPAGAEAQSPPPPDPMQSWFPYDDGNELKPVNIVQTNVAIPPMIMAPPELRIGIKNNTGQYVDKIIASEDYTLVLSTNLPGNIYIYEYYPNGYNIQGRWIAYKWATDPGGVFELGPFQAQANEPEGTHTYRAWFKYSGNWDHKLLPWNYYLKFSLPVVEYFKADPPAVGKGQSSILSWNVVGATVVTIMPTIGEVSSTNSRTVIPEGDITYTLTATNVAGSTTSSVTIKVGPQPLITWPPPMENIWQQWWVYTLIGLVVIALLVIVMLTTRKKAPAPIVVEEESTGVRTYTSALPSTIPSEQAGPTIPGSATTIPAGRVKSGMHTMVSSGARFILPNGSDVRLPKGAKTLGRNDFSSMLTPDKAGFISRSHVIVSYEDGLHYIEDLGSSNGTTLNGAEIQGKGKRPLSDGDKVGLADVMTIIFRSS